MIILDVLYGIKWYSCSNSKSSAHIVRDITVLPSNKAHTKSLMEKSL